MTPNVFLSAIHYCFYVYMLMIVARCLLTWFPNVNWENPLLKALKDSVDLYLDLFRKIIPPVGMFDFSPIVAFILLGVLEKIVLIICLNLMGMF